MDHTYNAKTPKARKALDAYNGLLAKYSRSACSNVNTSATWLYRLWIFNFWVHFVSIVNQLTLSSPNSFLVVNCLMIGLAAVLIFANREDHKILQAKKRFEKLEAKGELVKLSSKLTNLWRNRCIEAGIRVSDDSVQLGNFPALVEAMAIADQDISKIHEMHEDHDERLRLTVAIHESLTELMDAILKPIAEANKQLEEADHMIRNADKDAFEAQLRSRYTI